MRCINEVIVVALSAVTLCSGANIDPAVSHTLNIALIVALWAIVNVWQRGVTTRDALLSITSDPVFCALVFFVLSMFLSTVIMGGPVLTNSRLALWGSIPLVYAAVHFAAAPRLVPLNVLGFVIYALLFVTDLRLDNQNLFSANLSVGVATALTLRASIHLIATIMGVTACLCFLALDNHALLLGWALACAFVYRRNVLVSLGFITATFGLGAYHVVTRVVEPFHYRDLLWGRAWELFLTSPLVGVGSPINYSLLPRSPVIVPFAHNGVLSVLAEQGLVGLVALTYLVIVVARRFPAMPLSIQFLLFQLACVELVDEPHQYYGVMVQVALVLSYFAVVPTSLLTSRRGPQEVGS